MRLLIVANTGKPNVKPAVDALLPWMRDHFDVVGIDRAREAGLLGFRVPGPRGAVSMGGDDGRAVVYSEVPGAPLVLASVEPGPGLAAGLGRALAQIHELPPALIEDEGLLEEVAGLVEWPLVVAGTSFHV